VPAVKREAEEDGERSAGDERRTASRPEISLRACQPTAWDRMVPRWSVYVFPLR
jgi:hypothetical protein